MAKPTHIYIDVLALCSLNRFKTEMRGSVNVSSDANDELSMTAKIRQASDEICTLLNAIPLPYLATLAFDCAYPTVQGFDLFIDRQAPLLAVTTVTNGNTAAVASNEYTVYPNFEYPKRRLKLKDSANVDWTYTTQTDQAIAIAGTWGLVNNYPNCWQVSGYTLPSGGITNVATTFTFAVPANAEQFSWGDYLKLDSEVVTVTGSNTTTGVVTIQRASLGTTAAAHSAGIVLYQLQIPSFISGACAEWAHHLYQTRFDEFNKTTLFSGVIQVDNGLKARLVEVLLKNAWHTSSERLEREGLFYQWHTSP